MADNEREKQWRDAMKREIKKLEHYLATRTSRMDVAECGCPTDGEFVYHIMQCREAWGRGVMVEHIAEETEAEERWREFYVEWVACSYCAGAGDDPHGGEPECPVCGGHGETQRRCYLDDEEADDWEAERLTGTLPRMEGAR